MKAPTENDLEIPCLTKAPANPFADQHTYMYAENAHEVKLPKP